MDVGRFPSVTFHEWCLFCRSAHMLSRYRPRAPIIAVTRCGQTARQAHLYRGIYPVLYTKPANDVWAEDVDLRVNFALEVGEWRPAFPSRTGVFLGFFFFKQESESSSSTCRQAPQIHQVWGRSLGGHRLAPRFRLHQHCESRPGALNIVKGHRRRLLPSPP